MLRVTSHLSNVPIKTIIVYNRQEHDSIDGFSSHDKVKKHQTKKDKEKTLNGAFLVVSLYILEEKGRFKIPSPSPTPQTILHDPNEVNSLTYERELENQEHTRRETYLADQ